MLIEILYSDRPGIGHFTRLEGSPVNVSRAYHAATGADVDTSGIEAMVEAARHSLTPFPAPRPLRLGDAVKGSWGDGKAWITELGPDGWDVLWSGWEQDRAEAVVNG